VDTKGNQRETVFVAELWEDDRCLATRVATFVPSKHVALVDPELSIDAVQQDDQLVCQITAQSLAGFVELSLQGADVIWSDNYMDIPAGRTAVASCQMPDGWTLDQARGALRIRSLYDSYS
jgi:beta-mannosidase